MSSQKEGKGKTINRLVHCDLIAAVSNGESVLCNLETSSVGFCGMADHMGGPPCQLAVDWLVERAKSHPSGIVTEIVASFNGQDITLREAYRKKKMIAQVRNGKKIEEPN